jgi:hypothetical protein
MSSIQSMITAFSSEHDLSEAAQAQLIELVNNCFHGYVSHMVKEVLSTPLPGAKEKSIKSSKTESLDNPADAAEFDDLRKCKSTVLDDFCKEKLLRVGGTKKEKMDRVWRFLQGTSTEEDRSPRKTKKVAVKKEAHVCSGCSKKNKPCGIAATEEYEGCWYCWHHVILAKATVPTGAVASASQPAVVKPAKTPKVAKAAKALPPPPPPESDDEEDEEDEAKLIAEQQETPVPSDSDEEDEAPPPPPPPAPKSKKSRPSKKVAKQQLDEE